MQKHLMQVSEYIETKIVAGIIAAVYSDDLLILLSIFIGLECMDIFTRWLALSMDCFKSIYPQTPCGLWQAFRFLWQTRKWKWIKSTELRNGFCDKMLIYLLLLLLAALVDGALSIAHTPRILISITVTVLATTEALSILENLSDCKVTVITTIKDKFLKKVS